MSTATTVIAPLPQPALAVQGDSKMFPVRRIWCVGRNYLEHIRELGNDERNPPFFFAKHADMVAPDGATIPYPTLTKDMQHEVELVVALKSGGLEHSADTALDHVWGYGVGVDLTRRDLQTISRKKEQPWEIGKSFDHSAPCGALRPASEIGHPSKGKIWLSVNGTERQKGDLSEMIWNVAGDHLEAVAAGRARRRRHHHDRHAGRRRGAGAGRQDRMRRRRHRHAEGHDQRAALTRFAALRLNWNCSTMVDNDHRRGGVSNWLSITPDDLTWGWSEPYVMVSDLRRFVMRLGCDGRCFSQRPRPRPACRGASRALSSARRAGSLNGRRSCRRHHRSADTMLKPLVAVLLLLAYRLQLLSADIASKTTSPAATIAMMWQLVLHPGLTSPRPHDLRDQRNGWNGRGCQPISATAGARSKVMSFVIRVAIVADSPGSTRTASGSTRRQAQSGHRHDRCAAIPSPSKMRPTISR